MWANNLFFLEANCGFATMLGSVLQEIGPCWFTTGWYPAGSPQSILLDGHLSNFGVSNFNLHEENGSQNRNFKSTLCQVGWYQPTNWKMTRETQTKTTSKSKPVVALKITLCHICFRANLSHHQGRFLLSRWAPVCCWISSSMAPEFLIQDLASAWTSPKNTWLVVDLPLQKRLVNWEDYSQYMGK